MCELFAMSSSKPSSVSYSLEEFARHGGLTYKNKSGWGIAYFHEREALIVKEAEPASDSPWVRFIADQGMADMAHVNPDLVGPAGFKSAINQRSGSLICFNHLDARDGVTTALKQNRLLLAIGLVPGQIGGDFYRATRLETDAANAFQPRIACIRHAVTEGHVKPPDPVVRKLLGQAVVGRIRLGHNQQTGRILVDPMDDSGPFFTADA